jgi:16S rRNA (cytidine1402-2'-O)-methyltransferase
LSVAGLGGTSFRFVGFLPRPAGDLRRLIEDAAGRPETLVAFEAPSRLRKSLGVIDEVLPNRRIAVCRELTKLHEETFVGTAAEALAHFAEPRGEIVLLIEGAGEGDTGPAPGDETALRDEIAEMQRLGLSRAQATSLLSRRYATPRRRLYELWLEAGAG